MYIKPENKGKFLNRKFNLPYTTIINDILNRLCCSCGKYYPATSEYFYKTNINKIGLKNSCKFCCSKHFKDIDYYKRKNFNQEGLLLCKVCMQFKNIDEFNNNDSNPQRNNKSRECKSCESKNKKLLRIKNEPRQDLDLHLKNCLRGCHSRIKGLTKKGNYKGKDINITFNDLKSLFNKQNGMCAISGIEMTYLIGYGKLNYNISVDRIDSQIGYLKDNIQLVCSHINMMKGNLTTKELLSFCELIVKYHEYGNQKIA